MQNSTSLVVKEIHLILKSYYTIESKARQLLDWILNFRRSSHLNLLKLAILNLNQYHSPGSDY
ncbi:hypothetical protein HanPI659440_Chr06g0239621 [Helianthus annuus]|nr:hypothetical protein HanPI659440_Chr06g0239621 [Helianthus annuus]